MKLFWKIFFTTMFVSTICVTLSGYLLIKASFQSQLDSEVKAAQDYGEIVYYALADRVGENDSLLETARSIRIDGLNQTIPFGIVDGEGHTVFSSLSVSLEKTMLGALSGEDAGWCFRQAGGQTYIQLLRPFRCLGSTYYIEILRGVTPILDARQSQYERMIKILAGMLFLAGWLTFCFSKLLLRRVTALTRITKDISEGDLSQRAVISGSDEIALLSWNFNQMAERLEDKIHELEDEARRKELFVGSFSHELKTPLTAIIGFSDLLRQRELDAEQRRSCADYIFFEGKRLEKLSMRLLELIVLRQHTLQPRQEDIGQILEEVRVLMEPQLERAGIALHWDVQPGRVAMEAELIKTVFINLLDNARKAMDEPGKIILTGRTAEQGYTVSIQDTGKGMRPQELPRITDAFYMGNKSRAREQGGAGLGLAICSEILALHGFDIRFDSAVGVGTVVTITMGEGAK